MEMETNVFKGLKKLEPYVIKVLQRNERARKDDFILYGGVLKELGVDLKNTTLYDFLATAKDTKIPPFESVSRCRRHIQELMPELKDGKTAILREEAQEDVKIYNRSGIGNE